MYIIQLTTITEAQAILGMVHYYWGLVPDDTVHKGTSKHHKTDEKAPICGARLSINN